MPEVFYEEVIKMNEKLTDFCKLKADALYPDICAIRRDFHRHPEIGGEEVQTSARIRDYLSRLGIASELIAGYGVTATICGTHPEKKDITVAIRADIDALPVQEKTDCPFASQTPGVMHACGHDMHTAMLLGTAALLTEIRDHLKGNVKLLFQPAEENYGGAARMILEGCMKNPDVCAVLGVHVAPFIPYGSLEFVEGTMNAASCEMTLDIRGKSCHGAHPETGSDTIVAASTIICALQSVISRNIAPTDAGVITIGTISGGSAPNIITGQTVCTGMIRALTFEERDFLKERIRALACHIAEGFGCQCLITFEDSYPPLINHDQISRIVSDTGRQLLGRDKIIVHRTPSLGADDFAYFCHQVPSLYFNLGTGHEDQTRNYPLHSEYFNPKEDAMKTGILIETLGAMAVIEEIR